LIECKIECKIITNKSYGIQNKGWNKSRSHRKSLGKIRANNNSKCKRILRKKNISVNDIIKHVKKLSKIGKSEIIKALNLKYGEFQKFCTKT